MPNRKWTNGKIHACSACHVVWKTKSDFRHETVFVKCWPDFGLVLYNCLHCGTTVSLELYPGSNKKAIELIKVASQLAKVIRLEK